MYLLHITTPTTERILPTTPIIISKVLAVIGNSGAITFEKCEAG